MHDLYDEALMNRDTIIDFGFVIKTNKGMNYPFTVRLRQKIYEFWQRS